MCSRTICQILCLKDQRQGKIEGGKVSARAALELTKACRWGGAGSDADACLKGMANPGEYLASPRNERRQRLYELRNIDKCSCSHFAREILMLSITIIPVCTSSSRQKLILKIGPRR